MGLSFTIAAGSRQRSHSRVQVPRDSWQILLSQIRDFTNLEGRSPYLYLPGAGWPSYTPRHWGYLFVASYDSQGYGGGIGPRLHTGMFGSFSIICSK
jgi:hypothetical protein